MPPDPLQVDPHFDAEVHEHPLLPDRAAQGVLTSGRSSPERTVNIESVHWEIVQAAQQSGQRIDDGCILWVKADEVTHVVHSRDGLPFNT